MDGKLISFLFMFRSFATSEYILKRDTSGNTDAALDRRWSCLTKQNLNEYLVSSPDSLDENEYTMSLYECATTTDLVNLVNGLKKLPKDCEDVQNAGHLKTGIFTIYPFSNMSGIQVRCDMDTTTGGWTVIQRRVSNSDFYKDWQAYENGFGNLNENFWIGNKYIHWLTRQGRYSLRVDLTSMDGQTAYAEYREFTISDAESGYRLFVDVYRGAAGDSFKGRGNGNKFTTKDNDNDVHGSGVNCAVKYHGAWWYAACLFSNLNGDYGSTQEARGPVWSTWKGYYAPMKVTEMKIRRVAN